MAVADSQAGIAGASLFRLTVARKGFNERTGKSELQIVWSTERTDPYMMSFLEIPGDDLHWTTIEGNCRIQDPRFKGKVRLKGHSQPSAELGEVSLTPEAVGIDPQDPIFGEEGITRTELEDLANLSSAL